MLGGPGGWRYCKACRLHECDGSHLLKEYQYMREM
jgi:hypothetical protein